MRSNMRALATLGMFAQRHRRCWQLRRRYRCCEAGRAMVRALQGQRIYVTRAVLAECEEGQNLLLLLR